MASEKGAGDYKPLIKKLDDDGFVKVYESQLRTVRLLALLTNFIHSLGRFISFCGLAWAGVAVLTVGAGRDSAAKQLIRRDYCSVAILLVIEAIRYYSARFFGFFVLQKLIFCTTDPSRLIYSDSRRQSLLGLARILAQASQFLLLGLSILIPLGRLLQLSPVSFDPFYTSLAIFYSIVLFNAVLASISCLISYTVIPSIITSPSLHKYYDKIVWIGMEHGFLRSLEDIDFLSFSFEMMTDEYRRNQRAPVVAELYSDMMQYLYCDARFKGFEKAAQILASGEPYEREAAANIVGCWMSLMEKNDSTKWKALMLQQNLLSKLAGALDHEETGRAATSSFERLVKKDPKSIARVTNDKGAKLTDILIDRIHEAVEIGKSDKAIVFIKVWIHLLPVVLTQDNRKDGGISSRKSWWLAASQSSDFTCENCTPRKIIVLQRDLAKIVSDEGALKRTQAVAAYALHISEDPSMQTIMPALREKLLLQPRRFEHLLTEEKDYAFYVLNPEHSSSKQASDVSEWPLPSEWNGKVKHRIINAGKSPLRVPWLARRGTIFVSTVLSLSLTLALSLLLINSM